MTLSRGTERGLLAIASAAVIWRWVLAMRTPVCSEDGATYLWMAEQFARGTFAEPLAEPFAPLLPLLAAPGIALGVAPMLMMQLLGAIAGGVAVVPVALLAERLREGAAIPAALLLCCNPLGARVDAEVYTEPLFVLAMALGVLAGAGARWWWAGLAGACAFLLRPEGAWLPVALLLGCGRPAWRTLVPVAAAVLVYGAARAWCGHGFDPLPKWAFHGQRDDLGDRGDLLGNLIAVPWALCEAFGPLLLLAAIGAWRERCRLRRTLLWSLAGGLLAIVTFVVRRRFFVGWSFAVMPLAGAGALWLPRRLRIGALALCVAYGLWVAHHGVIGADRIVERQVGELLYDASRDGERTTGTMARVVYYAGSRPPPPRHFDAAQVVAMVTDDVHFVVLNGKRPESADVELRLAGAFARYPLPDDLQSAAERRGLVVLVRR